MRKALLLIIRIIVWPFSVTINENVALKLKLLVDAFYSSYMQSRFKTAPNLIAHGGTIRVIGGKYISLGNHVFIDEHVRLEAYDRFLDDTFTPKIIIGDNVVFNMFCHIGSINEVRIGNRVTIGARTLITDHNHGNASYSHLLLAPRQRPLYSKGPIIIGDYVTIGENCVILPGVTIGNNSVIGANSVVTRSIPPFSVVAGNPARVLKEVQPD